MVRGGTRALCCSRIRKNSGVTRVHGLTSCEASYGTMNNPGYGERGALAPCWLVRRRHTNPRRKLRGVRRAAHETVGIIFDHEARSLRSNERAKNETATKRKKTTSEYPMTSERAA